MNSLWLKTWLPRDAALVTILRDKVNQRFNTGAASQQFLVESIVGIHTLKSAAIEPILRNQWEEKLAAYADMFNLPPADNPVPNPPVVGTQVCLANLERLNIEPERIMSVHTLNPDRLATKADITKSLGR